MGNSDSPFLLNTQHPQRIHCFQLPSHHNPHSLTVQFHPHHEYHLSLPTSGRKNLLHRAGNLFLYSYVYGDDEQSQRNLQTDYVHHWYAKLLSFSSYAPVYA